MSLPDPVETFRQEAAELLETLEGGLLQLERDPGDMNLVNSVFRALHTLKGSGAMFGFTATAAFVHEFETAFDRVRKGGIEASPALVRVALAAKDHIHTLIDSPDIADHGGEPILEALRAAVDGDAAAEAPAAGGAAPSAAPAEPEPQSGWRIGFRLPADALRLGTNPYLLLDELRELGPCEVRALIGDVPPLGELDPAVCSLGWDVALHGPVSRQSIDDVFMFLADGMELSVVPLQPTAVAAERAPEETAPAVASAPAPAGGTPAPAKPAVQSAPADKASSSLRVPAERLDALMDRVGELVIAQARLSQLAATHGDASLKAVAEDMERLSAGLRDITMGIRMVPIGSLFGRFRRLVHDVSHELGKEIEFVTAGEETELDKTIIEKLADPLVHLIRNSVDHGLEDAEARCQRGKPAKGTVKLQAVYAGAEVAISVSDDGAGLNHARIRAKAEENGLIAPDAKLTEQELNQLVFAPGFSTAGQVTSLSGRGVGMDVVKRTIEGLRGSIDVATRQGEGTTMTLRLPLTLAIIEGMLVRVGGGRYSIPLPAVEECVELPEMAATTSRGRSFLDIRGSLVPFIRLREVFNVPGEPDSHQKVVIVSSGEGRVGLVVDQIIGNTQTVIKQLSKLHSSIRHFSGATILGDGTVALILDIAHLVDAGQADERLRNAQMRSAA